MPMGDQRVRVGYVAGALADGGGMARYARELLRALAERDDVELVVVAPEAARGTYDALPSAAVGGFIPFAGRGPVGRALWERHRLGAVLEAEAVDVVHGMKHLVPRTALPTMLTVHDLMPISRPEQFGIVKRVLLPHQFRSSLREADLLLSDSVATADRLAALEPTWAGKTTVALLGVAPHLLTVDPVAPSAAPAGPFALVVGDLSPRKNLRLLLDVWDDVQAQVEGLHLLAVGPEGWRARPTRRRLEEAVAQGGVVWASHVTDGELRWCYEHASVVLMPALEEGFGLPVIEALALGAPVVASTDAALVEASGGRASHVDVEQPEQWVARIVEVVRAGRRPGAPPELPTWGACAAATVAAYRSLLG